MVKNAKCMIRCLIRAGAPKAAINKHYRKSSYYETDNSGGCSCDVKEGQECGHECIGAEDWYDPPDPRRCGGPLSGCACVPDSTTPSKMVCLGCGRGDSIRWQQTDPTAACYNGEEEVDPACDTCSHN